MLSTGSAGRRRPDPRVRVGRWLLATLLDVGPDEVLGVLLEHVVDLVEDRVDVLAELLTTLLAGRRRVRPVLVVPAPAALALGLLLRHVCLLIARPDPDHPAPPRADPGRRT